MPLKTIPIVFHPIYSQLKLARNHRFPIEKYQALKDSACHLFAEKLTTHLVQEKASIDMLSLVHKDKYINDFLSGRISEKEMKRIGFPWTQQFVDRTLTAVAGTIEATQLASTNGIALNFTGGYHHAHPEFGSGFCVFNDLVIAAKSLLREHSASRVLIFDCDVHQGDGTAVCAESDSNIFTVSMHCDKNFPARKQQSDWDIGLNKHTSDDEYLQNLASTFDAAVTSFKPDFIIYDAGVDIHIDDDLGLLNVSTEGIFQRDAFIFEQAKSLDIPIAAVIGGGYQRDIDALTQQHLQLVKAAVQVFVNN